VDACDSLGQIFGTIPGSYFVLATTKTMDSLLAYSTNCRSCGGKLHLCTLRINH